MEYIVLASSPGVPTHGLLDLFDIARNTEFIEFETLIDRGHITDCIQTSATRVVFHGDYSANSIQLIHSNYPSAKNILVFDSPEAALLQHFSSTSSEHSFDDIITHWSECISQLIFQAEQKAEQNVLIQYCDLINSTDDLVKLLNLRMDIELTACKLTAVTYSNIAHLIAATFLLNEDEAMFFYDEAKTLALGTKAEDYTGTTSLVIKHNSAAFDEFKLLLKSLNLNDASKNTASVAAQQLDQLDIAQTASRRLHEEIEIMQSKMTALRGEVGALQQIEVEIRKSKETAIKQEIAVQSGIQEKLNGKESELEIALLQLHFIQEELEFSIEKYSLLEQKMAVIPKNTIIDKLIGELPLLNLLRDQMPKLVNQL